MQQQDTAYKTNPWFGEYLKLKSWARTNHENIWCVVGMCILYGVLLFATDMYPWQLGAAAMGWENLSLFGVGIATCVFLILPVLGACAFWAGIAVVIASIGGVFALACRLITGTWPWGEEE